MDQKDLFEHKSVTLKLVGHRFRQNFFTVVNLVKKRVSFYGIFRSVDKIDMTRHKLKHLRGQVD